MMREIGFRIPSTNAAVAATALRSGAWRGMISSDALNNDINAEIHRLRRRIVIKQVRNHSIVVFAKGIAKGKIRLVRIIGRGVGEGVGLSTEAILKSAMGSKHQARLRRWRRDKHC